MRSLAAENLLSLEETGGFYKYFNRRNFYSQLLKVQTETATHLVSFFYKSTANHCLANRRVDNIHHAEVTHLGPFLSCGRRAQIFS